MSNGEFLSMIGLAAFTVGLLCMWAGDVIKRHEGAGIVTITYLPPCRSATAIHDTNSTSGIGGVRQ